MKKILVFTAMSVLFLVLLSQAVLADNAFGFESSFYDILVGKTIKPKVVAQGIDGKLVYEWISSDESIATVKSGTVKGVSGGSVTLTCVATAVDEVTYSASCVINVIIPIKSIKVSKQKVTIAPSEALPKYKEYTPTITIEPENATNKDIEWSSSDIWVASVAANGKVVGRYPGTATITGKTMDGSGKKVSYTVTVPMCFVTDSKLTITDEGGATFGYCYASVGGISVYGMREKGDCFMLEASRTSTNSGESMTMYKVIPIKAGKGSVSFYRNGKQIGSVSIEVKKSAIRDKTSYPKREVSNVLADKDAYFGKQLSFTGVIINHSMLPKDSFIYKAILGKDDWRYSGIVNAYTEGKERQYFSFEYIEAMLLESGKQYTIYGTIDHYDTFTTETGLSYETPYLVNVTIGK